VSDGEIAGPGIDRRQQNWNVAGTRAGGDNGLKRVIPERAHAKGIDRLRRDLDQ
jgi:hypothetical protein